MSKIFSKENERSIKIGIQQIAKNKYYEDNVDVEMLFKLYIKKLVKVGDKARVSYIINIENEIAEKMEKSDASIYKDGLKEFVRREVYGRDAYLIAKAELTKVGSNITNNGEVVIGDRLVKNRDDFKFIVNDKSFEDDQSEEKLPSIDDLYD